MLWQILVGMIIYIMIGMIYYSPILFGNRWFDLLNVTPTQPRIGILTLITMFTSTVLYLLLQIAQAETLLDGALVGGCVGVIISLAYAKDFMYGFGTNTKKPLLIYLISICYHIIALTIIGTVMMFF